MKSIPGMTVEKHHELCVGVLAMCYKHVPPDLQCAIMQGLRGARDMGMNIRPENVLLPDPSHKN